MTDYSAMVGFDTDGTPVVNGHRFDPNWMNKFRERIDELKIERNAALARVKELELERDAAAERLAKVIGEREWLEQRVRDAAQARVKELERELEAVKLAAFQKALHSNPDHVPMMWDWASPYVHALCNIIGDDVGCFQDVIDRCEALQKERDKLLENQLPDLSQWPCGWAVGVNYEGEVWYLHKIAPAVNWEAYASVTERCTRLSEPESVRRFARTLHRALGRPCPWDETPAQEPPQPLALDEQCALLRKRLADLEWRLDKMEQRKTEEE